MLSGFGSKNASLVYIFSEEICGVIPKIHYIATPQGEYALRRLLGRIVCDFYRIFS